MRKQASSGLRGVLLFVLVGVSTSAVALVPPRLIPQPVRRSLYLSKDPRHEVPQVFVAGGSATTLRFDRPCDPSRTKLLGWEGRFEPLLVGGKSVVIVPLQDLAPGDRFLLLVTLMDGTQLAFTVLAARDGVDGQLDVFPDPESPDAVRFALKESREANRSLRAEIRRHREEQASVDHALATLLANDQVALTPFRERERWLVHEPGLDVEVRTFMPREPADLQRVAVTFDVTNRDPERPWALQEARITKASTRESRPFALRMVPASIGLDETGRIVTIIDLSSFDENSKEKLVLELFRDGGLRHAYVELNVGSLFSRR